MASGGERCLNFYLHLILLRQRIYYIFFSDTYAAWSLTHWCNGWRYAFEGPWADMVERKRKKKILQLQAAPPRRNTEVAVSCRSPAIRCLSPVESGCVRSALVFGSFSSSGGNLRCFRICRAYMYMFGFYVTLFQGKGSGLLYQQQTVLNVRKDN
jgi:hypothetical protein